MFIIASMSIQPYYVPGLCSGNDLASKMCRLCMEKAVTWSWSDLTSACSIQTSLRLVQMRYNTRLITFGAKW